MSCFKLIGISHLFVNKSEINSWQKDVKRKKGEGGWNDFSNLHYPEIFQMIKHRIFITHLNNKARMTTNSLFVKFLLFLEEKFDSGLILDFGKIKRWNIDWNIFNH